MCTYTEYIEFISLMVTPNGKAESKKMTGNFEEPIDAEISKLDRKLNYFMFMSIAHLLAHSIQPTVTHKFDF